MNMDYEAILQEAIHSLCQYIQINTSNPPGDVYEASGFLQDLFRKEDIKYQLLEPATGKVNLIARLPGQNPQNKPLVLLHHMDVVPADTTGWTVNPYGGVVEGDFIWGRGAIDDKGVGIMQLYAFILAKRANLPLKRDVIYLAVADEETGSVFGMEWLSKNKPELLNAEVVLDEGGMGLTGILKNTPVFLVSVAEKRAIWVKLTFKGEAGHGSQPHHDQANIKMFNALARICKLKRTAVLTPVLRQMLKKMSSAYNLPANFLLKTLTNPLIFAMSQKYLFKKPSMEAVFKDTLTVTMLRAGQKENVIPQKAEAILDMRLMPSTSWGLLEKRLKKIIGQDAELEILYDSGSTDYSSFNNDHFRIIENTICKEFKNALVVPFQTTGITDSRFFRRHGVNCYGILPVLLSPQEIKTIHGVDERISISNLKIGIKVYFELITGLAGQ